jgi:hypothetical protein
MPSSSDRVAGPPDPVEVAVGNLYLEFFHLRQAGKFQEEYDAMGTLIGMLARDRDHMRDQFKGEIKI